MRTRRAFLRVTAGVATAVAVGARLPAAAAAGFAVDPHSVAAAEAARAPAQWGMALPGEVTGFAAAGRQLALTFDACDRACDEALLDALHRNNVPALLFVSSRWIAANPGRVERLAADPLFDIGNHGTRHVPLSVRGRSAYGIRGTASAAEAVDEVWTNQTRLTALTGRAPSWFRPGTAYYDDVGVQIVQQLGLTPVGFSVNADNGATSSAAAVGAAVNRAAPGSIVLAHMNHPGSGTAAGVAAVLPGMLAAGWQFVPVAGRSLR